MPFPWEFAELAFGLQDNTGASAGSVPHQPNRIGPRSTSSHTHLYGGPLFVILEEDAKGELFDEEGARVLRHYYNISDLDEIPTTPGADPIILMVTAAAEIKATGGTGGSNGQDATVTGGSGGGGAGVSGGLGGVQIGGGSEGADGTELAGGAGGTGGPPGGSGFGSSIDSPGSADGEAALTLGKEENPTSIEPGPLDFQIVVRGKVWGGGGGGGGGRNAGDPDGADGGLPGEDGDTNGLGEKGLAGPWITSDDGDVHTARQLEGAADPFTKGPEDL